MKEQKLQKTVDLIKDELPDEAEEELIHSFDDNYYGEGTLHFISNEVVIESI